MGTTTFNGPVRSEKGFQWINKNASTGAITTRLEGTKPDLTSLTATVVGTGAALVYAKNVITVNDYTGLAAQAVTMPAATQGDVVIHLQAKDTAGGVNTLIFTCAGTDTFATGSKTESTLAAKIIMNTSVAANTILTFTPVAAVTNRITTGSYLYFTCFETGTWHFAHDLSKDVAATTGTLAWS